MESPNLSDEPRKGYARQLPVISAFDNLHAVLLQR
jgi:hypothetical protein